MVEYDVSDLKTPIGICSRHRTILADIDKAFKAKDDMKYQSLLESMPKTYVHAQLFFPATIRQMENSTECTCSFCVKADEYCGSLGNQFGKVKITGRPRSDSSASEDDLPNRESMTVCRRCKQEIGPGISHPFPCTLSDRRNSISEDVEKDPKLQDLITN